MALSFPTTKFMQYCFVDIFLLSLFETGIVVRNTLVTYDRADNKIGFWKTNCSELWRRLHFSNVPPPGPTPTHAHTPANASASAPTPAHISNKSVEIPPSLAPDGLPLGKTALNHIEAF